MKVLIMTAVAENELDLQIVMVARDGDVTMASPVVVKRGAVDGRRGNPYLVYEAAVEKFTGRKALETSISVFECRSGDLEGWADGDLAGWEISL